MSLGNLIENPEGADKSPIRTGYANVLVRSTWQDNLRYAGVCAAFLATFLLKDNAADVSGGATVSGTDSTAAPSPAPVPDNKNFYIPSDLFP